MRNSWIYGVCLAFLLTGCVAAQSSGVPQAGQDAPAVLSDAPSASGANVFNPYMHEKLPNTRKLSAEGSKMLSSLGGRAQSIEGEAAYRRHWREEMYPVVHGGRTAPHEVLVLLDYANPRSEKVWNSVADASRSIPAANGKVVLFGNSSETYGTDLVGFGVWLSYSRPGQAMRWIGHSLARWNAVKAQQKSHGGAKRFDNEYDATATSSDYPMIYSYLTQVTPPVTENELSLSRYCYEAGNVNMYQTVQLCRYYGVKQLPAVIVDGKVLSDVSAQKILEAMK